MDIDFISRVEMYRNHRGKAHEYSENFSELSDHISKEYGEYMIEKHQKLAMDYVDDELMDSLHGIAINENKLR